MFSKLGRYGTLGIAIGMLLLSGTYGEDGGRKREEISVVPQSTTKFIPPHTGGDQEFNGHGPVMKVRVDLMIEQGKLIARVYLHAKETQADNTEAEGHKDFEIYSERKVVGFGNGQQTVSQLEYTDTNHEDDVFARGAADPVAKFICSGDRKGFDAGIWTGVRVDFNRIRVVVE